MSEIASELNLSVKTVSTHKARLMEKMGIENQADLVRYAMRHRQCKCRLHADRT